MTIPGHLLVAERQPFGRGGRPEKANGEGLTPFPVDTKRPVMGGAWSCYGTVMVVPSPVAVMEKVPAVLDA